jgi:hypothetical protein
MNDLTSLHEEVQAIERDVDALMGGRLRSTSPKGVFGYGEVSFPKEVDEEMMPVLVTFRGDGDGIYPVRTSAPGSWDPRDFKWEYLSQRERELVLDEMCPEEVIQ